MSRKEENVIVPAWGGRDAGRIFRITEMDALEAETWAWRLTIALKGTNGHIPLDVEDNIARLGMVGVAIRGLNAFLASDVDFARVKPLLDEMLKCVALVRDPRRPDVATALVGGDIEEPKTVLWLRGEVLRVHTGFSFAEVLSALTSAMRAGSSTT